jgi:hypothetical protein
MRYQYTAACNVRGAQISTYLQVYVWVTLFVSMLKEVLLVLHGSTCRQKKNTVKIKRVNKYVITLLSTAELAARCSNPSTRQAAAATTKQENS